MKAATPVPANRKMIGQWRVMVDQSRFSGEKAGPMISSDAMVQRQKARAMGGISVRTARPKIKFPDQNTMASVKSR